MAVEQNKVNEAMNTAGGLITEGKTLQQIQTPYVTAVAVQKPRELREVLKRCLEEAELAGDDFYYGWPSTSREKQPDGSYVTKKSRVEGLSIDGAMAVARNFGNCCILQRPIQETYSAFIFTSAFVDQETGFNLERSYRMDKSFEIYGKMDSARKMDIRFAIGVSKSSRNVVNKAMPIGIVKKVIAKAKESSAADITTRITKRVKQIMAAAKTTVETEEIRAQAFNDVCALMLKSFLEVDGRLTCEFIEKWIDLPRTAWDVHTLAMLSGDLKGLKTGQHSPEDLFDQDETEETQPDSPNGHLSPEDMTAGDPEKVQGYEKKATPEPEGNLSILQKVADLRKESGIGPEEFVEHLKQTYKTNRYGSLNDEQLPELYDWLVAWKKGNVAE